MDEAFVRSRISQLRVNKGVSEYRMSTELGHSKSYIDPQPICKLKDIAKRLSPEDLAALLTVAERLVEK